MICNVVSIKINAPGYDSKGQFPKLHTYIQEKSENMPFSKKRPAVVICPGGAYEFVSDREAEPIAAKYLSMGFNCFILNYSVAPAEFPTALFELAFSVAYVRKNAEEFGINENKIAVVGFSAGGHLAASLSVFWQENFISEALGIPSEAFQPNASILSYPVITYGKNFHARSFENLMGSRHGDEKLAQKLSLEKSVSQSTPPAFIWHTSEDTIVPAESSLLYAAALAENNIPYELHIYQRGGHGLSLANEITGAVMPDCQNWIDMSGRWLLNLPDNKKAD